MLFLSWETGNTTSLSLTNHCSFHSASFVYNLHYYVVLQQKIDFDRELIMLSNTELTELKDLPKRIPKDAARYHFFLYKHTHEGDHLESIGKCLCVIVEY